jgi:macrolide transport system ATP-binding/permease protein
MVLSLTRPHSEHVRIGVRMALGAPRGTVYELILKEAIWLATLGIAIGILCSLAAANLLRSVLIAVAPWDPATLLIVASVLVAPAMIASYIPARRAASVDWQSTLMDVRRVV